VTLDGVMQGLGSSDEDRDGGFEHGGWAAPDFDDVQQRAALEGLASTTAYLFGRRTYEKMASFWPTQPDSNPIAAHLNATVKYVVTRTLPGSSGQIPSASTGPPADRSAADVAGGGQHRGPWQRPPRLRTDGPRPGR
jgi:dihydrofolate reductase